MRQITIEDFDKAVPKVAAEIIEKRKDDDGMGTFLFSVSGMVFAGALREKLFPEQKEEKEDK